jgi:hypothetical protein
MDVILVGFWCVSVCSSTVQLHNSLGSRHACACSEAHFSGPNGDRAWGMYYRRAEFFVRFCGQKHAMQRIFIKKYFLLTVRSVCRVKRFTTVSRNSLMDVRKSQMMPHRVWKWLRQQSKYFCVASFDALDERCEKCINVCGGYVEKYICFYFQFGISHVLRSISICGVFTDSNENLSKTRNIFTPLS